MPPACYISSPLQANMAPSSSLKIGGYSEGHLEKTAKDIVGKKTTGCKIFDKDAEDRIPRFATSELTIGRILGRGGFCVVSEIKKVTLKKDDSKPNKQDQQRHNPNDIPHLIQDRYFMEAYCIRDGKDARYAIKRISDDLQKDASSFINGVVDLAIEAKFLSVIRHPNIIKMRAVSTESPFGRHFFVILDRLYDTLTLRLAQWKKRKPGGLSKLTDPKGKKKTAFWVERIAVGYDLACALKYLHSVNVVYRDLKPDNIGFDVRGDVKIFDFGLAKEFDPSTQKNGCYNLTGDTGSTRYMAPEVGLSKPYNESVDVYSFAIIFYQILSLTRPFEGLTVRSFSQMVFVKGARPIPDPKWPDEITTLLKKCWSSNMKERPSMADVADVLLEEINANSEEEVLDHLDISTKSEMSLRRRGSRNTISSK